MIQKNRYVKLGLTAFLTVGAILLFYDTLFGSRFLLNLWRKFLSAAQPVLYGAFMAYLLVPVVDFFEARMVKIQTGQVYTKGRKVTFAVRVFSIFLTWTVIAILFYLLGSVLLPELYKSLVQLISNIETYYNTINGWIQHFLETNPTLERLVAQQISGSYETLRTWIQTDLFTQATKVMSIVSGGVFSVVGFFGDLLVGIFVSIYLLATKELCGAHARKIIYGLFSRKYVYWLLRWAKKVDRIFAGFVRGKLLDSLIIGILCFVGCSILDFPYTPLVSVIVGVTNVIPFFGPFLGAIPSIFLILLVSPIKALYFAIFVLALQQLDGNVIGPKILGDKTGLSNFWVIVAILVGGSFFGVPGMFFGVPVCACLYSVVAFFVELLLKKKNLPEETAAYTSGEPLASLGQEPLDANQNDLI